MGEIKEAYDHLLCGSKRVREGLQGRLTHPPAEVGQQLEGRLPRGAIAAREHAAHIFDDLPHGQGARTECGKCFS